MARRPRRNALAPLGQASNRLHLIDDRIKLLEKAGLTPERCAELVGIFVREAHDALTGAMNPLNPTQPDYHARMAAGKALMALIGANPPKTSGNGSGGAQVAVVIEMPEWASSSLPPKQVGPVTVVQRNPTE